MAIMNVLAELHQEHDLKLNLKFEIEVLCKNLALDINDLKPGNLLKDKDRLKNLDEQLSAPKKDVKQPEELPPITTTSKCDNELALCLTRMFYRRVCYHEYNKS